MKKISIVSDFNIFDIQGVNYVTSTFLEGNDILRERGYQVSRLYHPQGCLDCTDIVKLPQFQNSVKIHSVMKKSNCLVELIKKISKWHFLPVELIIYYCTTYRRAKGTVKLFFQLDQGYSDIVIFQGYLSAYMAFKYFKDKINFKAIIINHSGEGPIDQGLYLNPCMAKNRRVSKWMYDCIKFATNSADYLVILSGIAKKSFYWIEDSKKSIIYNGIRDILVHNLEQNDRERDRIRLVTVASLQKMKGQHLLLEAISFLPDEYRDRIQLNLVGDGVESTNLKTMCDNLNLNNSVIFWGNRSDVPQILAQMDVFILSSYTEGLPISIIEALRQGLLVLTSAVGGCSDMIDDYCGRIIPLDPTGISEALKKVIDDKLYENSASYSIARFKKYFSLPVMMNNYANVFDKVLGVE